MRESRPRAAGCRGVERRVHARRQVVPLGAVFEQDALGCQLVADPVGLGEVAARLGLGARGDERFDIAARRLRRWNQCVG